MNATFERSPRKDALDALTEAIRLDDYFAEAYAYRGLAHYWQGDHDAAIYNTRFNVFVRPHADGSDLTLPGLSTLITPSPLQKDAVWYSLQRQATLVGDEVGLGKTLTAIIAVMEAIRLGSAHKAIVVVPNHLTEQWRDAFLLAYPNASVLCAGKDEMSKGKRQQFMSRIATGKWDAVIVAQSSFKLLPVKPETMNSFIEAELEELRDFLQRIKAEKESGQPRPQADVSRKQAQSDLSSFLLQFDELLRPDGACPIHELDLDMLMPFSARPSAPYRMDLALTYRCNNDCAHCYNARERNFPELSTEQWFSIIDKLWDLGVPHIVFTVGEATLRDDLPELIRHAESNGQITGLNTNARRLMDMAYVEKLVDAGLDHVQILSNPACRKFTTK